MKTIKDLEREAYIKGDTATAELYDRINQAESEPCDCDDLDYRLYTDDEYEELLDDFRDLEIRYNQLKARMEGLEK